MSPIEEEKGKLANSLNDNDALMKSVMENDQKQIDDGKVLNDMINQGLASFQPDLAFEHLCKNYKNAKQIYGESLIREASGYSPDYIERNVKIPEFQRELKSRMNAKARELQDKGFLGKKGEILDDGLKMAALSLYMNEMDHLIAKGIFGEHTHPKPSHYGARNDIKKYVRGDRFRNLAIKHSVKTAIRRGHEKLLPQDLAVFTRESKGDICIMYALDASGSMRGKKIEVAKKAGVALAYKATLNKDKVGIVVFSDHIVSKVEPTTDFTELLSSITTITASKQTDIAKTIESSCQLFPQGKQTRHLILLTDAESTVGDDPKRVALEQASAAAADGITISVIGIQLDEKNSEFARSIAQIGNGKLYLVQNLDQLDTIVLTDYDQVSR
ncbi:MAG TPA: VWA domain-containing protein [Acidobacteriota bacterium]|nr:VWA domain-containing protein [Acidobacteriota bacterium]